MSAYDIHCAIPRAMMTKDLKFLMRRSMREASGLKLHFCFGKFILLKFLGYTTVEFYWLVHANHAILIMVLSYVYKDDRVLFFDNLPNALCCSTLI